MTTIHPQYITDENGEITSVVLPMSEFELIMEELDELDDIRLYDEAKKDDSPSIAFDEYVKQRRSK